MSTSKVFWDAAQELVAKNPDTNVDWVLYQAGLMAGATAAANKTPPMEKPNHPNAATVEWYRGYDDGYHGREASPPPLPGRMAE